MRHRYLLGAAVLLVILAGATYALTPTAPDRDQAGRVPVPLLPEPAGEACIADPETMRREHMHLLAKQKRDGVRHGIRRDDQSLQACVDCHAVRPEQSLAEQSRLGSREPMAFCINCHSYNAVRLDCFECHSSTPSDPDHRHTLEGTGVPTGHYRKPRLEGLDLGALSRAYAADTPSTSREQGGANDEQ
ncbi:hypothetical protein [Alkalilimnicola ehrlichii]|uniref:hypothetical protein n=1 Tax=Alkalilimnicola ehrlichii TaxID=351052 RepID=UPI003BA16411